MHFLEAARFLNALVLAGRKVNFTLPPLCSHLNKITNVPTWFFLYGACPLWF